MMSTQKIDLVDSLSRLDYGELDEEETIELFQNLVDTGLAWQLQGRIGRQAMAMIEDGTITPPQRHGDCAHREGTAR